MINKTFKAFPVLTTERLTLRQLVLSDEEEIFRLRSDGEVNKYLHRQLSSSIDDARNFINKINENFEKNDSLYWAITFTDNNTLIGTIALFSFSDEHHSCEIGFELLPNFQQRGIMTEAAAKVVDYVFNTINLNEIKAFCHRDNQRSLKLLERLRFKESDQADKTDPDLNSYHLSKP